MRNVNMIVVHCSASRQNATVEDIKRWHTEKPPHGNGWSDIGYHYIIDKDGVVHTGRPIERSGAHTRGYNSESVGICWIGGYKGVDNRTGAQKLALRELITDLIAKYDIDDTKILGHRDLSPDRDGDGIIEEHEWLKSCPNFDVQRFYFIDVEPRLGK